MTDAPKHPATPDPANELASDHSPIDPRDFRNALGTYATGVTIIRDFDRKPFEDAVAPLYEKAQRDPAAAQLIERIRKVE